MPNSATTLRWLGGAGLAVAAVLWIVGSNIGDPSQKALLLFLSGVSLNLGVLAAVAWVGVDVLAEEHRAAMEPLIAEQRRLTDAVAELARTRVETELRDTASQ